MTTAYEWDGIGPKDECLLLLKWDHDGSENWVHFRWCDTDVDCHAGYYDDAGSLSVTENSDHWSKTYGKFLTCGGYTVTHYAALPTIARVIELSERIRNDVEEGAVAG